MSNSHIAHPLDRSTIASAAKALRRLQVRAALSVHACVSNNNPGTTHGPYPLEWHHHLLPSLATLHRRSCLRARGRVQEPGAGPSNHAAQLSDTETFALSSLTNWLTSLLPVEEEDEAEEFGDTDGTSVTYLKSFRGASLRRYSFSRGSRLVGAGGSAPDAVPAGSPRVRRRAWPEVHGVTITRLNVSPTCPLVSPCTRHVYSCTAWDMLSGPLGSTGRPVSCCVASCCVPVCGA